MDLPTLGASPNSKQSESTIQESKNLGKFVMPGTDCPSGRDGLSTAHGQTVCGQRTDRPFLPLEHPMTHRLLMDCPSSQDGLSVRHELSDTRGQTVRHTHQKPCTSSMTTQTIRPLPTDCPWTSCNKSQAPQPIEHSVLKNVNTWRTSNPTYYFVATRWHLDRGLA
jgi:hypothetical protein